MLKQYVTAALAILISTTLFSMNYTVEFKNVNAHYVTVTLDFETDKDELNFKVPVWTPGSYKVREFSNAFQNVSAEGCTVNQPNKNTWTIVTNGKKKIKLTYDVYCFVRSVRQSYADQYEAFLHGVSAFGYVEGYEDEEIILTVKPKSDWKDVEVALEQLKAKGFVFRCDNYDLLADSPIAAGNFDKIDFVSGSVPHRIVMMGKGSYDLKKVVKDFKKICDTEVALFGEHPSPHIYIHFIQNIQNGSGGLEHQNCQTSSADPNAYTDKKRYERFLALISHEYFHLWNVKRIRAIELGPFEYNKENYTDMLWVAEGITSYYDDLFMYRAGYLNKKEYLKVVAEQINRYENTPGRKVMSAAESSRLAWVKAYMPNENSHNTAISYYNKGMIISLLLDLEIIRSTGNKASLDDVLRDLYAFYKKNDRGFTHKEFVDICSNRAGKDLTSFFEKLVYSTEDIDYASYFNDYGLSFEDKADKTTPWSGASTSMNSKRIFVQRVISGSAAEQAGLSVGDEILAVNGLRLEEDFDKWAAKQEVGSVLEIQFARVGRMHETKLTLGSNPNVSYVLKTDKGNDACKYWLGRK